MVALTWEIEHHTGDTLRHALDASGVPLPRVVVDMRQVTFMDSETGRSYGGVHRLLEDAGATFRSRGSAPRRTES